LHRPADERHGLVAAAHVRGVRLARSGVEAGPEELLPAGVDIDGLLGGPPSALAHTLWSTTS
jgi:hypothetical protein